MLRVLVTKPEKHYYDHEYGRTLGIIDELDNIWYSAEELNEALADCATLTDRLFSKEG